MVSYLKTFILLGLLSVILITIGRIIGGQQGIIIAFIFSLVMNGGMYFFSDKLALSASGAKLLEKNQYPELFQIVEELSQKMGIPMPKLYITPNEQANAFATGRGPQHASVAVTTGILKTLNRNELNAVLAHELGHVKNYDILIASIAAVLASTISFLANMSLYGGFRGSDENEEGTGILGIFLALLIPLGASIIQLAISRQREFGADETGARTMGDGEPLAEALIKIQNSANHNPMSINPAFSSLYISNPFGDIGQGMMRLFSTHPPVEERVRRLREL